MSLERTIRFERTSNLALVKSILTQPGIWPHIGDDYSPQPEAFRPNADSRIWYVLVFGRERIGHTVSVWPDGLFSFVPENPVCWAVHVAMVRGMEPWFNHQAGQEIVPWLWANSGCQRLVASVPTCNRAAIRFGLKAMGLTEYGRNPNSFMKQARLWDQVLMGVSRPGK